MVLLIIVDVVVVLVISGWTALICQFKVRLTTTRIESYEIYTLSLLTFKLIYDLYLLYCHVNIIKRHEYQLFEGISHFEYLEPFIAQNFIISRNSEANALKL